MPMLSESAIITLISQQKPFCATLDNGAFTIKVEKYVPFLCTAIHAGHTLREDMSAICALNENERLQEEDPFTELLIEQFPITLSARDSRYEYDLNRHPQACIYTTAWQHDVWRQAPSAEQRQVSQDKHNSYYRILQALCNKLTELFSGCLLFDIHSYNYCIRQYDDAPVFNIGTAQTDMRRWRHQIAQLIQNLQTIELPNLTTDVAQDQVFQGRGYQATFARQQLNNCLLIPLEIKKVFMDEIRGERYPLVFDALQQGLHRTIMQAAETFSHRLSSKRARKTQLLPRAAEDIVYQVDTALYRLAKNFETLNYVNPINLQQEKKRFLSRKNYQPDFHYRQLRMDPYDFKEKLYRLPVSQIHDPVLRNMYRAVVDAHATKVELITHVGTPQFLYNSLRYYGEPNDRDISNARFILHACELPDFIESPRDINAEQAIEIFRTAANKLALDCQISQSSRLVAKAMVSGKKLMISRDARLNQFEINALIHHELGVHMVTSLNADQQALKILKLGLPGNTYTQEGLAILSEYLSGNMNIYRLKQLSLRVLAVEKMIKGHSFKQVFEFLQESYRISTDEAFNLTTRVFRGGGFTKDYLYLRGFRDMVNLHQQRDISNLLTGKTSVDFIQVLDNLTERGVITPPKHMTPLLTTQQNSGNQVLDYIVSAIH